MAKARQLSKGRSIPLNARALVVALARLRKQKKKKKKKKKAKPLKPFKGSPAPSTHVSLWDKGWSTEGFGGLRRRSPYMHGPRPPR